MDSVGYLYSIFIGYYNTTVIQHAYFMWSLIEEWGPYYAPVYLYPLYTCTPCTPVPPVYLYPLYTCTPCTHVPPVPPVHMYPLYTCTPCTPCTPVPLVYYCVYIVYIVYTLTYNNNLISFISIILPQL